MKLFGCRVFPKSQMLCWVHEMQTGKKKLWDPVEYDKWINPFSFWDRTRGLRLAHDVAHEFFIDMDETDIQYFRKEDWEEEVSRVKVGVWSNLNINHTLDFLQTMVKKNASKVLFFGGQREEG